MGARVLAPSLHTANSKHLGLYRSSGDARLVWLLFKLLDNSLKRKFHSPIRLQVDNRNAQELNNLHLYLAHLTSKILHFPHEPAARLGQALQIHAGGRSPLSFQVLV